MANSIRSTAVQNKTPKHLVQDIKNAVFFYFNHFKQVVFCTLFVSRTFNFLKASKQKTRAAIKVIYFLHWYISSPW